MSTPSWKKPVVKMTEAQFVKRTWHIDLDEHKKETGMNITPADLFDPTLWSQIRTRKLFDRDDALSGLREGELCRVVRGGPGGFDIDLVVKAALPGGLVMALRGADTPWNALVEAEKNAVAKRRQAVQEAAAAVAGETL